MNHKTLLNTIALMENHAHQFVHLTFIIGAIQYFIDDDCFEYDEPMRHILDRLKKDGIIRYWDRTLIGQWSVTYAGPSMRQAILGINTETNQCVLVSVDTFEASRAIKAFNAIISEQEKKAEVSSK